MLPHLRRLPDRIDRMLMLAGRGDLRVRSVVDEDSRRILRTLVNRGLLAVVGAVFLIVSAMLLVAAEDGPWSSAAASACSRSSATEGCWPAPCSACGSSPAWPGTARYDRARRPRPAAAPIRPPPAVPASRSGRPASATSATRATSSAWCSGRSSRSSCCARSSSIATDTSEGSPPTSGARRVAAAPTAVRELALALAQVGAIVVPRRRRRRARRAAAVAAAGRRLLAAAAGVAALVAGARRRASTCPGATAGRVTSGTWVASTGLPVARLPRRRRPRRPSVGKAWLSRAVAAGQPTSPSVVLVVVMAHRRHRRRARPAPGPRRRPRRRRRGPGGRRRAEPPADAGHGRGGAGGRRARRSPSSTLAAGRGRAGAAVPRRRGSRGAAVREGLRRGQPRRRRALPRLPRAASCGGRPTSGRRASLDAEVEQRGAAAAPGPPRRGRAAPSCERWSRCRGRSHGPGARPRGRARRSTTLAAEDFDDALLDAVWREVGVLHDARLAHRSLRDGQPRRGRRRPARHHRTSARAWRRPRRARSPSTGPSCSPPSPPRSAPSGPSPRRRGSIAPDELAAVVPFLQPLALSVGDPQAGVEGAAPASCGAGSRRPPATEPPPLEQLVRVRPRTLLMIAALTARLLRAAAPAGQRRRQRRGRCGRRTGAGWPWPSSCRC